MELIILVTVLTVLGIFTIKCMKREDELIELEDRIISEIKEFHKKGKKTPVIAEAKRANNRAA